jgi:hypothetical protein
MPDGLSTFPQTSVRSETPRESTHRSMLPPQLLSCILFAIWAEELILFRRASAISISDAGATCRARETRNRLAKRKASFLSYLASPGRKGGKATAPKADGPHNVRPAHHLKVG